MIELTEIANVVAQTGLPIGLIIWGVWFLTMRVWPWFSDPERRALDRAVEAGKADALRALAVAISCLSDALADCDILERAQTAIDRSNPS